MIDLSDKYLLMVEPTRPATEPIRDELTALAEKVYAASRDSDVRCKGFHLCACGECSDNADHILPGGVITNSLMVHYVQCHRDEIPLAELGKLRAIAGRL